MTKSARATPPKGCCRHQQHPAAHPCVHLRPLDSSRHRRKQGHEKNGAAKPRLRVARSMTDRGQEAPMASIAKWSANYWFQRLEERQAPPPYSPNPEWSPEYLAEIARLEPTDAERRIHMRSISERILAKLPPEEDDDLPDDAPFNDMEIDILKMARFANSAESLNWRELPLVKDVSGLKAVREEWRARMGGPECAVWPYYLLLLDPEVRATGKGYLSPPPLEPPWQQMTCDGVNKDVKGNVHGFERYWSHPHEKFWLVDDCYGGWFKWWHTTRSPSRSVSPAADMFDDNCDMGSQSSFSVTSAQYSDSPNTQPRMSLRSSNAPTLKKMAKPARGKRKKIVDSKLLARTHGLTASLGYRNRILVTEWAVINVPRAGMHRAWAKSGLIPYNPSAVLETLTTRDPDEEGATVARNTRLREKTCMDSMVAILQDPTKPAPAKFAQLYVSLQSAMNAESWQRRSMFADSRRKPEDSSDDDEDDPPLSAYHRGGIFGGQQAQDALLQQEEDEAALEAKKPFVCQFMKCKMRYVTETGLANHIRAKHTYPGAAIVTSTTATTAAAPTQTPRAMPATPPPQKTKTNKICELCGGNANHKSMHETTQRHKTALAKQ